MLVNTAATSSNNPAASSRNALGLSHGWGVGLAHSGSYLGTLFYVEHYGACHVSTPPPSLLGT